MRTGFHADGERVEVDDVESCASGDIEERVVGEVREESLRLVHVFGEDPRRDRCRPTGRGRRGRRVGARYAPRPTRRAVSAVGRGAGSSWRTRRRTTRPPARPSTSTCCAARPSARHASTIAPDASVHSDVDTVVSEPAPVHSRSRTDLEEPADDRSAGSRSTERLALCLLPRHIDLPAPHLDHRVVGGAQAWSTSS